MNWRERTGAAFEPTVLPLLRVWDLHGSGRVPTHAERESALEALAPNGLTLDAGGHSVRHHELAGWESGAFGKGAALDAAMASLRADGICRAVLDFGGQLSCIGIDATPRTAVAHPRDRDHTVVEFAPAEGSLATSGNSERGIVIEGRHYGHLLDPRSGQVADDFGSVTVFAPSALDADCLSTALYVLGPDRALEWVREYPRIDVLVLQFDGEQLRARLSPGLDQRLLQTAPEVRLELGSAYDRRP